MISQSPLTQREAVIRKEPAPEGEQVVVVTSPPKCDRCTHFAAGQTIQVVVSRGGRSACQACLEEARAESGGGGLGKG